jgi:phytanoyl-CoA hydroxylase
MPRADSPPASPPETIPGNHLYVNDGLLDPSEVGHLQPSFPNEDLETLRERFRTNGYIWLKGLMPREDVIQARHAYFAQLAPTGILKAGTTPDQGIFNDQAVPTDYPGMGAGTDNPEGRPGNTETAYYFTEIAMAAHTADWYIGSEDGKVQGFAKHPAIRDFVARFTGWGDKTHTIKRTLIRNNCPGNKAVGVHYDQIFLRHGEPTAMTAWVPIGDVKPEGGGLIYLEGSEKIGEQIENEFSEKAKANGLTPEEMESAFNRNMMKTGFLCEGPKDFAKTYGGKWLIADYEAGDIVLHSPHMVRRSKAGDGVLME